MGCYSNFDRTDTEQLVSRKERKLTKFFNEHEPLDTVRINRDTMNLT